jgi:D-alanyl-lipoteichoic acid acyltransferase DltB (MBOAT superfamily)
MSYLSPEWLFWLWLTVCLYWLAPRGARRPLLIGLTLAFLLSRSTESAFILVAFCGITHLAGNVMRPVLSNILGAAVTMVAVLVYYKLDTTISTENLLDTLVIPLGLSYYTFRCIHFLVERYKGTVGRVGLSEVAGYLFFLPTIVVGPIHRFDEYKRDELRQRFDGALISEGAERILYGYAKIVVLSNFLVEGVMGDYIASLSDQDGRWVLYLQIVQNGLNLFLQFSGYSDIAIGFARLLGYRVQENFNWPYLQPNISAFWRSWHMSLSRWCRDYIYSVVVANTRSPALGAIATMVAIGLWHEISLRFLLWGAYHAVGIIVWQRTHAWLAGLGHGMPRPVLAFAPALKVMVTVHFVWLGFVILSADGPLEAVETFARLLLP